MRRYFHGENKSGPYFEGWYFKCQAEDGKTIAMIPAVHSSKDGEYTASLQIVTAGRSWWLEYPAASFGAARDRLSIQLDENRFSMEGLLLDIEREGLSLHGQVEFRFLHPLQSDIMGPFRWVPGLECVHSVISMRHRLQGRLELNGEILELCSGKGYIEADRGRSFPSAYLWTQCMWEDHSLMLSIATIPFGKLHFTGCICAVVMNGKEYRIATYRGAKIRNWSSKGVAVHQGRDRLEVLLLEQSPQTLHAPTQGDMIRSVHESLCAKVRYRFWRGRDLVFDHTDANASFEYAKENT